MMLVGTFVFEIQDASDPQDGYEGDVTLAGVRVGTDREDLAVGDTLLVPVSGGRVARATVVAFPLISFIKRDWRAVSVTGVKAPEVLVGGRAERAPKD
jgi:hypothetical protein